MYGEEEIRTLATRFHLSEREAIRTFREYMKYREECPRKCLGSGVFFIQ
jgi:hypothetical protein